MLPRAPTLVSDDNSTTLHVPDDPLKIIATASGAFRAIELLNTKGIHCGDLSLGSIAASMEPDCQCGAALVNLASSWRSKETKTLSDDLNVNVHTRLAEEDARSNTERFMSLNTDEVRAVTKALLAEEARAKSLELKYSLSPSPRLFKASTVSSKVAEDYRTALRGRLQYRPLDDAQSAVFLLVSTLHEIVRKTDRRTPKWESFVSDKLKMLSGRGIFLFREYICFEDDILNIYVWDLLVALADCVSPDKRAEMVNKEDVPNGSLSPLDRAMYRGIDAAIKDFLDYSLEDDAPVSGPVLEFLKLTRATLQKRLEWPHSEEPVA